MCQFRSVLDMHALPGQLRLDEQRYQLFIFPVNYEGRACGVGDLENYKSLYYPWVMIPEMNMCVDECPTP